MEYGLIGEKLGHSFSKEIHTKYFGLKYDLKELSPNRLETFFKEKDFKAVNVTIPYKQAVIPYLDVLSEEAEKIGAVNVIVNDNGLLKGYNTDFSGLKYMIKKSGVEIKNKKVLILGDGATSKTALAVAEELGAKTIFRVSRKQTENTVSYEKAEKMTDTEIIINTTPVGMYPNCGEVLIDVSHFPKLQGVFDVIYNPLRSKLVLDAKNMGIFACGGLNMLVAQAVFAAEKFIGKNISTAKISEIYSEILKTKENIVLVGMPSSGKSTVGRMLSKELDREFIDIDCEIVKQNGNIRDIFENSGEKAFRDLESNSVKDISVLQGKVIATGGGTVLRPENVNFLKMNGKIYFLDRSPELLQTTQDRPLAQNRGMIEKLFKERYGIYKECSDVRVNSNSTPLAVMNIIKGDFLK